MPWPNASWTYKETCVGWPNGLTLFTKESEVDNGLSFLNTITNRVRGRRQVSVYRKLTHTDRYSKNIEGRLGPEPENNSKVEQHANQFVPSITWLL